MEAKRKLSITLPKHGAVSAIFLCHQSFASPSFLLSFAKTSLPSQIVGLEKNSAHMQCEALLCFKCPSAGTRQQHRVGGSLKEVGFYKQQGVACQEYCFLPQLQSSLWN